MLKHPITFEDFNGDTVTEVHYFNLSKLEILKMEVEYTKGFGEHMQAILDARNNKEIVEEFQKIILMAYGQKSEDGKRFVKNDEIREAFSQTAAFEQLFIELASDANKAGDFIVGIVPKDMAATIVKEQAEKPKSTSEIAAAQNVTETL